MALATELLAPLNTLSVPQLRKVYAAAAKMLKCKPAWAHQYDDATEDAYLNGADPLEMTHALVWFAASQCRASKKTGKRVLHRAHTLNGQDRWVDEEVLVETHEDIISRLVALAS